MTAKIIDFNAARIRLRPDSFSARVARIKPCGIEDLQRYAESEPRGARPMSEFFDWLEKHGRED